MKSFDLNSCRSKLEDHYQETATVPTSVWCKKSFFDIHRIYTRLSFVKDPEKTPAGATQSELKHYSDLFTAIKKVKDLEKTPAGITSFELKYYTDLFTANKKVKDPEETPAGTTSSELKHYTDLFTANKSGVIPKRILVQGQTGIGKSTFVKKLLVDWVEVNKGAGDEQAALLKNFELVVAVNLKEVSKYQSLVDVIRESNVFAKEDKYMTEGLVDYITNNQEKVLLIFDGYDEYRCGRDSEIYQIFSGNYLRSCCVLITTRISKADDLQGGKVLHAEITGFSEVDREEFMRRFFKNSEDEASELKDHLDEKDLDQLAKVPLLLLFFCILWRKGHSKSFPKSKTTLYMDIIQFILNHSQSKQSPPQYLEVISFKEILSEIGKIALQALLKNDHLFEYSQLCDSVRCDKSVLIGLLQITEYSESEQQVGIVSFIHKSIQEFLAAWYVTYRCIPEGGNLGEIGLKLEECFALENVFEFICGLSKEGAVATFRHLKSVRISDPSLDLSQTAPNLESETDVPLSDVTYRHWQFSDLVLDLFEKVESKADLSRPCLDCLGNVLLFSERTLLKDLLLRTKEANPLSLVSTPTWLSSVNPLNYSFLTMNKVFEMLVTKNSEIFKANPLSLVSTPTWLSSVSPLNYSVLTLNKLVKMLVTENSEIFNVAEFLEKFENMSYGCRCGFSSVLCFFNGQVYLYITHLELLCQDHAGLFTDHVFPSYSLRLSSGHLSLKYLKVLKCSRDGFSMERLGAVVKHCNHLELIDVSDSNDTLSHFLQHVLNYRRCSLLIRFCCLSSKGAVELSYLLPRFENIIHLDLRLAECSDEAVTKLVAAIKHKTLEILTLSETKMTSAAAEALSQSLPQLSVLRTLEISSLTECSDVAVTNLVAVIKHKNLEKLQLNKVNLPLAAAEALSQSLLELSSLQTLTISSLTECSDVAVTKLVAAIKHKSLKELQLSKVNLTSAVAEVLRQSLSELSALESLSIGGVDGCSLQLQIFSSYTLRPLSALTISGCAECSAEAVTRLIDVMKHKPLEKLKLSKIHLTSAAAEALSQSLPALSALQALKICGLAKCSSRAVTSLVASIKHTALNKLTLSEINLTTAVAEALGQSIWKLSALQTLKISVPTECPAEAETSLAAAFKHKPVTELKLSGIELTLEAAEALSQFLWKLSALQTLKISVSTECPAEAVTNLAAAFKHKPITEVILSGIKLTLEAAEALGQSLWKLSALQTLEISVSTECSTETVTGLAAAFKHETLNLLKLSGIKLTLEAGEALGQSLGELSALQTLKISVSTECSAEAVTSLAAAAFKHKPLKELKVSGIKLTLEAAKAMGQSLLEVPHLALELSGFAECSAKEAIRLLEEAIPSRNFIRVMSVVIPHVGYSEFKVKNVVR